jgi:hypothetical protein
MYMDLLDTNLLVVCKWFSLLVCIEGHASLFICSPITSTNQKQTEDKKEITSSNFHRIIISEANKYSIQSGQS